MPDACGRECASAAHSRGVRTGSVWRAAQSPASGSRSTASGVLGGSGCAPAVPPTGLPREAFESARIRELVRRTEVSNAKESQLGDNRRSRVEGGAEAMSTTPAGRDLDSLRAEIAAWSASASLRRRGVRQRTKSDVAPCRLKTGPQRHGPRNTRAVSECSSNVPESPAALFPPVLLPRPGCGQFLQHRPQPDVLPFSLVAGAQRLQSALALFVAGA